MYSKYFVSSSESSIGRQWCRIWSHGSPVRLFELQRLANGRTRRSLFECHFSNVAPQCNNWICESIGVSETLGLACVTDGIARDPRLTILCCIICELQQQLGTFGWCIGWCGDVILLWSETLHCRVAERRRKGRRR